MSRHRQEFKLGSRLGGFIVVSRTGRVHRGRDHIYLGVCVVCGATAEKTLWNFKTFYSHHGCPALAEYKQEPARKQNPGGFKKFIKENYPE